MLTNHSATRERTRSEHALLSAIFTNNLNTSTHYGPNCFACHTVGFDPEVANGGIDDAPDYGDFLASGLLGNPDPNNWTTMLANYFIGNE